MKKLEFESNGIKWLLVDIGELTESQCNCLGNENFKYIGCIKRITEEQASEVVESYEVSHNLDLTVTYEFKDYVNGITEEEWFYWDYWDEYPFDSAIDSLHSLLKSKGIYLYDNPIKDIELSFGYKRDAEEKTFYNPILFKIL